MSYLGINPKIIALELNLYYHNISRNKKEQLIDLGNPRISWKSILNYLYLDKINFLLRNKKLSKKKLETISLVAKDDNIELPI